MGAQSGGGLVLCDSSRSQDLALFRGVGTTHRVHARQLPRHGLLST